MEWDDQQVIDFVVEQSGEKYAKGLEGPAVLGEHMVWRCWTFDGDEYHAHYAIATAGRPGLEFRRDFGPFAVWLMRAFNAKDVHGRQLDWLRSGVAAVINLSLLGLVIWAVMNERAETVDFKWLVGALAATSLAYLLGGWTRRSTG